MQTVIERFFEAWSHEDASSRTAMIRLALSETATYSDPRSDGRLVGVEVISDYVGQFSANAPGWSAVVESVDEVNGYAKATVAFGGPGPDGEHMAQLGTYFAEADDNDLLIALAGFVGG